MSVPEALTSEIQKLAPSAVIELFVLDATSVGGDVFRFHAGTNQLRTNIVWDGETYVRFPVSVSGFEMNGQGQFPRPKMVVSNILSAITTILLNYGDLLGAKVTRKRTLAKYLDAVNFTGGVNADADPTAEFPEDVYYIDRKAAEDRDTVEFELASSVDLVGVYLPRRQIIQNLCPWVYRGADCGFTGPPLYDINDERITTPASAEAQALINTYDAIQISKAALAAAESALSAATVAMDEACEMKLLETKYVRDTNSPNDPAYLDYGVVFDVNAAYGVSIPLYDTVTTAFWNGSIVSLGAQYRIGAYVKHVQASRVGGVPLRTIFNFDGDHYKIERWGYQTSECDDATDAYDTALADRDAKLATYESDLAAHEAALAAIPEDDELYRQDRCGKRLTSCKLRFGETGELSFGGFPASGLVK